MAIDILLRLIANGDNAKKAFSDVREAADKTDKAITKIGQNNAFSEAEAKAKKLWDSYDEGKKSVENLEKTFETARNWGAGIAVAGGAAVALSGHLSEVYREGARADEKLSAMMSKRGEGGGEQIENMAKWAGELADKAAMVDDDPIKEAAAGLYGFGLNGKQVQEILPGLIGQSRLYGQSLDSVAQAFGRAYASGNASALKRSGVTLSQADLDYIEAATSEVEKQHRMFEKVSESMQKYALSMTEGLSESEKAANRAALEMDNLQTAVGKGAAEAQLFADNFVVSILRYMNASEDAASGAGWVLTIGGYFGTAAGSALAFAGQVGMLITAFPALGVAGTTAFASMSAAAIPVIIVLGQILAVALLAAAAIYALDKALHWKEDKELAANIAKGDEDSRKLYELQSEKWRKQGKQVPTYEQWQEDPNADDTISSGGDSGAMDIANLQRQADALKNPSAVPVPSGAYVPSITSYVGGGDPKAATAAQKAAAAVARSDEKLQDRIAKRQANIEIAQIEEMYATRIARLEATKPKKGDSSAIDKEIQKVKAEQMVREAQIRGRYDDSYAEGSGLEVARIRARGLLDRSALQRAGVVGGGSSGNAAIDGINAARGGFSMARTDGSSGGGVRGGGSFNVNLADHVRVGMDAGGNYVLNFVGQVLLPQPRIVSNVNGLRN